MSLYVTVRHIGGEERSLRVGISDQQTRVRLHWPLSDTIEFSKATGHGLAEAVTWRLTESARLALKLPPFREPRDSERKLRVPKLNDAQKRTVPLFKEGESE